MSRKAFEKIKAGLERAIAHASGESVPGMVTRIVEIPDPPPAMSAADIRRLRKSLDMSQVVFASALNAAPQTVHAWEQGRTTPSGPALRLLQIVKHHPAALAIPNQPGRAGPKSARSAARRRAKPIRA